MNWTKFFIKEYGENSKKKDKKLKKNPKTDINKRMMAHIDKHGVIDKDKDADIEKEQEKKRVNSKKITIDEKIDLHMYTTEEALKELQSFFDLAVKSGWRKVRIIHGKGKHSKTAPVLQKVVKDFLDKCPYAGDSGYEKNKKGGTGATWVMIKNPNLHTK